MENEIQTEEKISIKTVKARNEYWASFKDRCPKTYEFMTGK